MLFWVLKNSFNLTGVHRAAHGVALLLSLSMDHQRTFSHRIPYAGEILLQLHPVTVFSQTQIKTKATKPINFSSGSAT